MQVTNREISTFRVIADLFVKNTTHAEKNKLWYAASKMLSKTEGKMKKALTKQQEINRDTAMTDGKDKRLVVVNDKYQYTRDGAADRDRKLELLWDEKVELTPHFVSREDLPVDDNGDIDLSFEYSNQLGQQATCSHYEAYEAFKNFIVEPLYGEEEDSEE